MDLFTTMYTYTQVLQLVWGFFLTET